MARPGRFELPTSCFGGTFPAHHQNSLSFLQGTLSAQLVQIDAEKALRKESQLTRQAQETLEERQLKVRALDLSRDIGEFAKQVFAQIAALRTPPSGIEGASDPGWKIWEAQLENIHHNAVAQYNDQFGASVKDVVGQLRSRGVLESKTDCDGPRETPIRPITTDLRFLYVVGCAGDLQRAASKLH